MFFRFLILFFGLLCSSQAQVITNGNFSAGETGWTDCAHETEHTDDAYGGTSTINIVGEVDSEVALCQTISGFTVGNTYRLTFKASRRTNDCSPNPAVINFSIDGGALDQNLTKTNATFNLTSSSFVFKATRATHVLRITNRFSETSTCGVLFDDLMIELVLPMNFIRFDLRQCGLDICVEWQVSSNSQNTKYEVQRSHNSSAWETISYLEAIGESSVARTYNVRDIDAGTDVRYYRINAYNEHKVYSTGVKSIKAYTDADDVVTIFPNPTTRYVEVSHSEQTTPIVVINDQGSPVFVPIEYDGDRSLIDFGSLRGGLYFLYIDQICYKVVVL
jgi:hypothetical protein